MSTDRGSQYTFTLSICALNVTIHYRFLSFKFGLNKSLSTISQTCSLTETIKKYLPPFEGGFPLHTKGETTQVVKAPRSTFGHNSPEIIEKDRENFRGIWNPVCDYQSHLFLYLQYMLYYNLLCVSIVYCVDSIFALFKTAF